MNSILQERQISAQQPVIVGGALVVPAGYLSGLRPPVPGPSAIDTTISERIAVDAVMAIERELGRVGEPLVRLRRQRERVLSERDERARHQVGAERREQSLEKSALSTRSRNAQQCRRFVEAATGWNGLVHMQLPEPAVEVGAAQSRGRPHFRSLVSACRRCKRPTYWAMVPLHDTGSVMNSVSSRGSSKPSPI